MYVCIDVCLCVYMCIIYIDTCMLYVCLNLYVCLYVCVSLSVYVFVYVCMQDTYIYIFIY